MESTPRNWDPARQAIGELARKCQEAIRAGAEALHQTAKSMREESASWKKAKNPDMAQHMDKCANVATAHAQTLMFEVLPCFEIASKLKGDNA